MKDKLLEEFIINFENSPLAKISNSEFQRIFHFFWHKFLEREEDLKATIKMLKIEHDNSYPHFHDHTQCKDCVINTFVARVMSLFGTPFEQCIDPEFHKRKGETDCNGSCQLFTNRFEQHD